MTLAATTVLVRLPKVFDVTSKLKVQEAPALRVAFWRVIVAAVPEAPVTATDPPVQVVEGAVKGGLSLRYNSPETGLFRLSGTIKVVSCCVLLLVIVTVARVISPCLIGLTENDLAKDTGWVIVTLLLKPAAKPAP